MGPRFASFPRAPGAPAAEHASSAAEHGPSIFCARIVKGHTHVERLRGFFDVLACLSSLQGIDSSRGQVSSSHALPSPVWDRNEEKLPDKRHNHALDMADGGRDKKSTLCVFFRKGACRNGDKCPFSHGTNSEK